MTNWESIKLLTSPLDDIARTAIRVERGNYGTRQYIFADGSSIQQRRHSGRSALSPEGWKIRSDSKQPAI